MIDDNYAPQIEDPDDPDDADVMSKADADKAAAIAAIMFPELIDKSKDRPPLRQPGRTIMGNTFAQWAAYLTATEFARIDSTLRAAINAGLDNTEVARRVIGSADRNGVDGVTEITRQQMVNLAKSEFKSLRLRG